MERFDDWATDPELKLAELCGSSLPVIEVRGRHDDARVMAGREGQPVTLHRAH